jgi:PD-(D/E)XK nuclease superfamily protein
MSKVHESFAERMKEHQIAWAHQMGFSQLLELRKDKTPPWVLKGGSEGKNVKEESWWQYIKGREHKWARSLLSSQCFAVNVFGPLVEKLVLAKRVLEELLPHRTLEKDDEVSVLFEHTPKGAPQWLGETRQPTQGDVFFTIQRFKKPIGYLLVEVKFTNTSLDPVGEQLNQHPPRLATLIRLVV